jgi:hypothetical protein
MEELVDLLAENTHNLWAKERIGQQWTYGLNEDSEQRRSPHLLPYVYVDEAIKVDLSSSSPSLLSRWRTVTLRARQCGPCWCTDMSSTLPPGMWR